jgi:hypothetical protein
MSLDRRECCRVPDSRLITEIFSENPFVASIVNVSDTGIYTVKPLDAGMRGPRLLQLEIPIPEAGDSVWATGEVMFEAVGRHTIGAGIRFRDMARAHRAMIADLVEYRRQQIIGAMLQEIKWRKQLAVNPYPMAVAPPPVAEDTVRMYLLPDALAD